MTYSINTGVRNLLHWEDYLIFALTLLVSVFIGIYHAIKSRRNNTTNNFLVGNREMNPIPVGLSVSVTFLSALTLLGMPAEVYLYDTMFWWLALGMVFAVAGAAHLFIPFLYRLGITSAYEYFERRFGKPVRVIASLNWIAQTMMYLAFVLFAPSLALNAVTGLNLGLSISAVGIIVTIYTALGGMKTVLWTDSIQAGIILIGLSSLLWCGSSAVGGLSRAWEIAGDRDRLRFFDFNPNPGVRHSFWSVVVGGAIMWVSQLGVNQSQVQRLLSCPTLRQAKMALWISAVGLVLIVSMSTLVGILLHALYADCNPKEFGGIISSTDQLVPLFAMDVFSGIRVMPGIFLACIFSGSLSTLSSALNAMSAVFLEDYIRLYCCHHISDFRATLISKCLVLVCGGFSVGLAFVVSHMKHIIEVQYAVLSIMDGPLLGLFVLGMFFPWGNMIGAVVGYFVALVIMLWIGIGSYVNKVGTPTSSTYSHGCNWTTVTNSSVIYTTATTEIANASVTVASESSPLSVYKLSYLYYTATGMALAVTVGIVISLLTRRWSTPYPPELSTNPLEALRRFVSDKFKSSEKQVVKADEASIPLETKIAVTADDIQA